MSEEKQVSASAGADMVKKKLSARMAEKFGVEPAQLMATLKATAFRVKDHEITDSQMIALLVVSDQYGLNPFTKEIYAYPDTKTGGIVPVIGIDGWNKIMNRGDNFQGIEYSQSDEWIEMDGGKICPDWMEAKIWIKGREKPCIVREYLDECYRPPFNTKNGLVNGPWQSHTKRMLRHKVTIQCARIAFGFAGIYDEDEADRIVKNADFEVVEPKKIGKPQNVPMPTPKTNGNQAKPAQDAPKPDDRAISPTPEMTNPKELKPPMTEVDYLREFGIIVGKLYKQTFSEADIKSLMIKNGFNPDYQKAKEVERAGILKMIGSFVEPEKA